MADGVAEAVGGGGGGGGEVGAEGVGREACEAVGFERGGVGVVVVDLGCGGDIEVEEAWCADGEVVGGGGRGGAADEGVFGHQREDVDFHALDKGQECVLASLFGCGEGGEGGWVHRLEGVTQTQRTRSSGKSGMVAIHFSPCLTKTSDVPSSRGVWRAAMYPQLTRPPGSGRSEEASYLVPLRPQRTLSSIACLSLDVISGQ